VLHLHAIIPQTRIQLFAVNADSAIWPAVIFAILLPVVFDAIDGDHSLGDGELGHAAAGNVKLCELALRFGHSSIMGLGKSYVLYLDAFPSPISCVIIGLQPRRRGLDLGIGHLTVS